MDGLTFPIIISGITAILVVVLKFVYDLFRDAIKNATEANLQSNREFIRFIKQKNDRTEKVMEKIVDKQEKQNQTLNEGNQILVEATKELSVLAAKVGQVAEKVDGKR